MKFETILWDLNGTLLNDLHVAVSIINRMLKQRDLKQLSIEQYLEVFTFPVSDYYEQIGFDRFAFDPKNGPVGLPFSTETRNHHCQANQVGNEHTGNPPGCAVIPGTG